MTTENKKISQFVTPIGTAYYAHVFKPAVFEGKITGYEVSMVFDDDFTEKLKKKIDHELQKAKESGEFVGKPWRKEPFLSYSEKQIDDPVYQGATVFKFSTGVEGVNKKTGETFKRQIPVYDAAGKPIKKELNIGNGTRMKICFALSAYNKSRTVNGIKLFMLAIQIVDLVEYSSELTADKFGFEEIENGFIADEEEGQFEVNTEEDAADEDYDGAEF